MSKSKKPRKIYNKNPEAKANIKAVQNMQEFSKRLIILASQSSKEHVLLFKDNKPTVVTKGIANMFAHIRFTWSMMFGVLCRDQQENLYCKYLVLNIPPHIQLLASDLDSYFTSNLKKLFALANPLHRLTTFYAATPSQEDIDLTVIAQALHHFKVPDIMSTQYEIDTKNGQPEKLYCEGIWQELFVNIKWQEFSNFVPENIIIEPKQK